MKNSLLFKTLFFALLISYLGYSQKVAVIGMNHVSPDGLAFVALENIASSEVIYFTEDEYNNTTDLFSTGESVVQFTATQPISKGGVVFIKEFSTNTFTVTCTSGDCGIALEVSPSGPFALASGGEHMYAYSDSDNDPTNGVTEIYSVMYTVAGSLPALEDPTVDFPNAIVVDGFASGTPDRTEYMWSPATVRDGVLASDLENSANYLNGAANVDLSLVAFTNLTLSLNNEIIELKVYPNPVSNILNINANEIVSHVELYDINGRLVLETKNSIQLNVSQISEGLYLLKITVQDNNVIYKKIAKN
ncbi:MAG: T9SS type A sorting domain-containing protein [Bacteroidia bacterium]|nr:T9SS type A sorting domain-containing protein [Bacteroidia bacterium]MBT8277404.1 T9SS type A sorting domain-containing protein [Bacteroidia bacterium]NNL32650.1 T9SS type A sorting domain-containing protein [Flavobacteriaceae bacterium]